MRSASAWVAAVLRVSCEVLAYQDYAAWAWQVLPVSALLELSGLTVFAINVAGTFVLQAKPRLQGADGCNDCGSAGLQ